MSEWLFLNANSAIFQLNHVENTLSWILIVLADWNNSSWIDMLPHSDTLSRFQANQSLLFLLNAVCLAEIQNIPILLFLRNCRQNSVIREATNANIIAGFDINVCPIARGKWNASSGKWKRHPTCPIRQVKMILWYVQFLKSKMINIELFIFSVGSRCEFYLNIASYVSCILLHFVLFCWLRNSLFSNKDRVIYISQSRMPN